MGTPAKIVLALALVAASFVAGSWYRGRTATNKAQAGQPHAETVSAPGAGAPAGKADAMPVDPVCGMDVDPAKPAGKRVYKGKTYYFCSDYCVKRFDSHPEEYAGNTGS